MNTKKFCLFIYVPMKIKAFNVLRASASLCLLVLLLIPMSLSGAVIVKSVDTAAKNVIRVAIDAAPEDADFVLDLSVSSWRVNGGAPVALYRYSVPWDEFENEGTEYPVFVRHFVYIQLSDDLIQGTDYSIVSPYGNAVLPFDERSTHCESIKVNQVGYHSRSNVRYANYGIFLGDGGTVSLSSLPAYDVIDELTGSVVYSGMGVDMGLDEGSGEHVYQLDLSGVGEGGPYFVSIPGVGRSYSFGVGEKYSRRVARVNMRGLFHNRCGLAMEEPYTAFVRGQSQVNVANVRSTNIPGWVNVPERAEILEIYGGYHDAGDFDRRPMHTIIPIFMLSYFELFPENFVDQQYNIPDIFDANYNILGTGNGIPDFLDEAMWGVLLYEYLQLDASNSSDPNEYGAVMAGTEANAHPGYGLVSADTDTLVYGTYEITGHTTASAAGMFAHASRLMRPFDTSRADELLVRAVNAWEFLMNNPSYTSELESQLMYAASQLYLATATGDSVLDMQNEYHQKFLGYVDYLFVPEGQSWPQVYKPGWFALGYENKSMIFSPYFMSYLLESEVVDTSRFDLLKARIFSEAETMMTALEGKAYPVGREKASASVATGQGWTADILCMAYRLSNDPVEKQEYFDVVSQLADHNSGLNALGRSYVTGLGQNQVNSPSYLDSWYTKYGFGAHYGHALGNVHGVPVFGPQGTRGTRAYELVVTDRIYPVFEDMPRFRRYGDGWSLPYSNEFTVWQTSVINVCMHGFLTTPGIVENILFEDSFDSGNEGDQIDDIPGGNWIGRYAGQVDAVYQNSTCSLLSWRWVKTADAFVNDGQAELSFMVDVMGQSSVTFTEDNGSGGVKIDYNGNDEIVIYSNNLGYAPQRFEDIVQLSGATDQIRVQVSMLNSQSRVEIYEGSVLVQSVENDNSRFTENGLWRIQLGYGGAYDNVKVSRGFVPDAILNQKPVLELSGDPLVEVAWGGSYQDAGCYASDVEDGDIESNLAVTIINPLGDVVTEIDPKAEGTYLYRYNVVDSFGIKADEVERQVVVLSGNESLLYSDAFDSGTEGAAVDVLGADWLGRLVAPDAFYSSGACNVVTWGWLDNVNTFFSDGVAPVIFRGKIIGSGIFTVSGETSLAGIQVDYDGSDEVAIYSNNLGYAPQRFEDVLTVSSGADLDIVIRWRGQESHVEIYEGDNLVGSVANVNSRFVDQDTLSLRLGYGGIYDDVSVWTYTE